MAFGKRTDDVIGSTPNEPKLVKYIIMDNKNNKGDSKEENQIKKLNIIKDDLFDDIENDEDIHFLSFDDENFIPIEENLNKIYDLFLDPTNQVDVQISYIHQEKTSYLFSPIGGSNLRNSLNQLNTLNLYLTVGFIEYGSYKAPLFFIPINLKGSFINRDYNRDIKFNYFLKAEIESCNDIIFPKFNGCIKDYFHDLNRITESNISNKSFIGNFYFRKLLIYDDLSIDKWDSINEKIDCFFNNNYIYSIEDFKNINDAIAKKWDNLDLKYFKDLKIKGADKLIINLLSQGNTILYISSYYSKHQVKKSLDDWNLNSLVLDFDYDLDKYDIFKNFDNNLINMAENENTSNLVEIKTFNEKLYDLLSKNYSNINLTPFEIQQKIDEFSGYDYDIQIEGIDDISLEEINKYNNDLDFILDNFDIIKSINNSNDEIVFSDNDYKSFIEIIKLIQSNIIEFKEINKELNDNYGIMIFNDLNFPKYIKNFDSLNENSKYIVNEDYDKLNELIKTTYEYNYLENNRNTLVSDKLNSYIDNIFKEKFKLEKFNEKIDEIYSTVEFLDISDSEFKDYIDYISLLQKHPVLVDDEESLSKVIGLIELYYQKKNFKGPLNIILKKFIENNEVIDNVINEFDLYLNDNNDKLVLFNNIKELSKLFNSAGFNFKSLNDYLNMKDQLRLFGDAVYIQDKNFFKFNDYLKNFIEYYNDSIKNYFYQRYALLKSNITNLYKDMENRYSDSYKKGLFENINKILKIQKDLSFNFNNFEKLLENKDFIQYLNTKPVFDLNFDDVNLVNNFERLNNLNIETSVKDYVDSKITEYINEVISINGLVETYLKNNYDLEYIKQNIYDIINIKDKLGVNFNSIQDFMNNLDILDILVQRPQFNYNLEEYELYLEIDKICQFYKIDDINDLLNYLNNTNQNNQNLIEKELEPVLNSEYDLIYIRDKVNEIVGIIQELSEIINCIQIESFNEIDGFIKNIQILKNQPTFIEEDHDFDSYLETINFLKDTILLDDTYLKDCEIKLLNLKYLNLSEKLSELNEIVEICYENDTSRNILNWKKNLKDLKKGIDKLNIRPEITDLDLDECIESLKPKIKLSNNYSKNKSLDLIIYPPDEDPEKNFHENSILKEFNNKLNLNFEYKQYLLESKNYYLNSPNIDFYLYDVYNNNELFSYLKNKNISKNDLINEINLLKLYLDKFNKLYDEISNYISSNFKKINEYYDQKEIYDTKIEKTFNKYCPNSFKGIKSNIGDLKNEINVNRLFSNLVISGFFKGKSYDNLSFDEINKKINSLIQSKKDLDGSCKETNFNLEDSFQNIVKYISNLLNEIEIFNNSIKEISSLNYLNEYIPEDLLFEYNSLNENIVTLSNLDENFVVKCFKTADYSTNIKNNIKLVDKFNDLIKNKIFSDKTIKYLECYNEEEIKIDVYNLNILLNAVCQDSIKRELSLDCSFDLFLEDLEKRHNEDLKLKRKIDENYYLLKSIDFLNYENVNCKISSFVNEYSNKYDLGNEFNILKDIVEDLDNVKEIYKNYKYDLMNYSGSQINEELSRLKNNLIFNNLLNENYIKAQTTKDTNEFIHLIDETKDLINETDYTVSFDELIEINKNNSELLNIFEEKYNKILRKISSDNLNYLEIFSDIKELSNEFSINLDDEFHDLIKDVESNKDLIDLCFELDINDYIFNLSKSELIEYTQSIDLNKEFSELIDNNIFSKDICEFYKGDFESGLDEIDSLSSRLIDLINEDDLNKNIEDIVDINIQGLFKDYSEIKRLMNSNSTDLKELIKNYLEILEKIYNISSSNIFVEDFTSDILKEKVKLDYLIDLYELEIEIQTYEALINKHFNEILNSTTVSIDKLNEKFELDMELTKYYNEGIFSDETIKNASYINIDVSMLNELIPDLFSSNDYLSIYDNNKYLLDQINEFNSNLINSEDFIINTNKILKDDKIEDLLKLDVNSQLIKYESKLASLNDIKNKYVESDDLFNEIENNIKYSELIDNKLFDDEEKVKSNISNMGIVLNNLNEKYYAILKDVYKVNEFYNKFTFFKFNKHSFNNKLSFERLIEYLKIFEGDLNFLNNISDINSTVKLFIEEVLNQNLDKNKIKGIFNRNVYKIILNNFYEEYPDIVGNNLDYMIYKKEIDKIDSEINKNKFNQVLADIYRNLYDLNKKEEMLKQKESFNQLIDTKKLNTVKNTLNEFKEYILSVKPIFLMDIIQFYEYISNEYESSFDYVILDKNFEFEELDQLCLFLRSKNKLIDLR